MTHPIVACARGWIGTRFHHQGRLKKTGTHKGGVDCLGLLVGVAAELDLRDRNGEPLAAFDETDYAHMPDAEYLRKKLEELLIPVPVLRCHSRAGGNPGCAAGVTLRYNSMWIDMDSRLRGNDNSIIPGDIVLLRIDESPQHLAIVSDFLVPSPLPPGEGLGVRAVQQNHHFVLAAPSSGAARHLLPEGEGIGLGLIHAYAPARAVVEHVLDDWWRERIEAAFRAPHLLRGPV